VGRPAEQVLPGAAEGAAGRPLIEYADKLCYGLETRRTARFGPGVAAVLTRRALHVVVLSLGAAAALPVSVAAQESEAVTLRMRVDDSVRHSIPPILQRNLSIEQDQSEEAKELIRRAPPGRAVPVMFIVVGVIAMPVVVQVIRESLFQTHYGGVLVDMRSQPASITSDPKIPSNLVFVIDASGKMSQFKDDQLSAAALGPLLRTK